MANILISSRSFCTYSNAGREILENSPHTILPDPFGPKKPTPEEMIPHVGNADAMICDLETMNREVLAAAKNLKIISRRGVGVDSIDLSFAKEEGITITRTVGVVEQPVAELVMAYLLHFGRKVSIMDQDMKNGVWKKALCDGLDEKTLGIVGLGSIGKTLAPMAKGIGLKVCYYDPLRDKAFESEMGVQYHSFTELLEISDFVTLHLPLTDGTKGMMNHNTLRQMKPDAFLINTARGAIVDENDLYNALKNNVIAGAAIDVYDVEPNTDSPLRELPNAVLTPHIATSVRPIVTKMDIVAAQNIIDFFT